jgi:hypothetical protein
VRGGLGGHGAAVIGEFGGSVKIGVGGDVVVIDVDAVVGNERAAGRAVGLVDVWLRPMEAFPSLWRTMTTVNRAGDSLVFDISPRELSRRYTFQQRRENSAGRCLGVVNNAANSGGFGDASGAGRHSPSAGRGKYPTMFSFYSPFRNTHGTVGRISELKSSWQVESPLPRWE